MQIFSLIFQNQVTNNLNKIQHKKKTTNNKKKTTTEPNTNIGVHLDLKSLNQDERKTQIENKLEHKKLNESHFVKLCLKSLSMDVLALCKEKQLKTGIDMTDIVNKSRDDETLDDRKSEKKTPEKWHKGQEDNKQTKV